MRKFILFFVVAFGLSIGASAMSGEQVQQGLDILKVLKLMHSVND